MNKSPRVVPGGSIFLQQSVKSGARIHFDAGLDERAAPCRQFSLGWREFTSHPYVCLDRSASAPRNLRIRSMRIAFGPKATPEWRSSRGGGSCTAWRRGRRLNPNDRVLVTD